MKLPYNTNHYFYGFYVGALQIANSEAEDAGKYECVAENSLGTEFSQATQLYVKGMLLLIHLFSSLHLVRIVLLH